MAQDDVVPAVAPDQIEADIDEGILRIASGT
jgi:hypothetical protein